MMVTTLDNGRLKPTKVNEGKIVSHFYWDIAYDLLTISQTQSGIRIIPPALDTPEGG
jgi:hypothetical protein